MRVYANNAATTFPKPEEVIKGINNYLLNYNVSSEVSSQGSLMDSVEKEYTAEEVVFKTREKLCKLFNFNNPSNVVFTKNVTESINIILKGYLKAGDRVVVSAMEHNAVMTPLNSLSKQGIKIIKVPCNNEGFLNLKEFEVALEEPNIKLCVMIHASNVTGSIMPVYEASKMLKGKGIPFILDAAQTAGAVPIDFERLSLSALCFTGHKALLGPEGIGGFLINDALAKKVKPFIEGGTEISSELSIMPEDMPEKFEGGTQNIPGIFGLSAALDFILKESVELIRNKEEKLSEIFIEEIQGIKGIKLIGSKDIKRRLPVFSLTFDNIGIDKVSYKLRNEYNISNGAGLFCAPLAHEALGTLDTGTLRLSFSYFTTEEEIDYIARSLRKIIL